MAYVKTQRKSNYMRFDIWAKATIESLQIPQSEDWGYRGFNNLG
jgi:glucose-6-phosphate 1-dehydrogenase